MQSPESPDTNVTQTEIAVQGTIENLERTFRDLQRQVERLQRLASLGTVSAMVAHEFNNVLTPIISYCQYALQRGETELMRTALDRTLKNAQRLAGLSGRILGLASPDQMGPLATPLRPLVEDTAACLGRDLSKDSITLVIDVPEGLSVRAHKASLEQVLFNLILNARQAMLDRPGRLTIAAREGEEGRVTIDVSDTGCGIKPENIDHVFEPFFSTKQHESKPDRGGVGLGLHVCKRLMADQDGDISVQSRPGAGTTFTLNLPGA
jgi:C4-dicarboxylate-specific signal transduction histidine kinase